MGSNTSWSKLLMKEFQNMDFSFLLIVSNEGLMSTGGHRNGNRLK